MNTVVRNFFSVLRRFKMATLLNILGLSVAFAAFIIIMIQVNYDYNFDRYHTNHDHIFRVEGIYGSDASALISRPVADAIIASSPHIQAGALYVPYYYPQHVMVETGNYQNSFEEKFIAVYPSITDIFEFDMLEGTSSSLEDPEKVLISESLAKKMFGSTDPAVGNTLKNDFQNFTIGGIYKDFPANSLVQNGIYLSIPKDENKNNFSASYELYIRLDKPENSAHIIDNFESNFDFTTLGDLTWVGTLDYRLTSLPDIHFINDTISDYAPKSSRQTLLILLLIACIIVIIAGINYTNFSIALTPVRIRSINTQKVFGGNEKTIRNSLLLEAINVNVIAFMIAILLIYLSKYTFITTLLDTGIILTDHPWILAGTALIALATGLLAGLFPSYYMTSFQPALVLKGNFGLSPKGRKMRNILIGMQFVASLTLIIGASFMFLQNRYMQQAPLGYDKDRIIVTNINKAINNRLDAFTNQIKAYSGIEDVTYSEILLTSKHQYMGWERKYRDGTIAFQCLPVNYTFLKVTGIHVDDGRDFRQEDELTTNGALIFNEKARVQYNMHLGDKIDDAEIIGFMPDIKFATFHKEIEPMAFYVWGTHNWTRSMPLYAYVKLKPDANMNAAFSSIHTTLEEFDPAYPFSVRFYDKILENTYQKELNLTTLVTLFSLIAIFISIVGVFGLVVFESEYRKKEIGIRKVLGSTIQEIFVLFNKTYIRILTICFIFAAPMAYYAITKWFENFAYKVPLYWWVFIMAFAVVMLITIFTVTFQSWRIANLNPTESIKTE